MIKICEKINHYIHFTDNSADQTAFKPIADRVYTIKEDMTALADELGQHGEAIRFISDAFGDLYDKMVECIKTV